MHKGKLVLWLVVDIGLLADACTCPSDYPTCNNNWCYNNGAYSDWSWACGTMLGDDCDSSYTPPPPPPCDCTWTQNYACPTADTPGTDGYAKNDGTPCYYECCPPTPSPPPPPPPTPSYESSYDADASSTNSDPTSCSASYCGCTCSFQINPADCVLLRTAGHSRCDYAIQGCGEIPALVASIYQDVDGIGNVVNSASCVPSFPIAIVVPLAAGLPLLCGCVVALACIVSRRRKKRRGAQLAEMTPTTKVIEVKATVEAGI